jgi:hypothetical protein
MKIHLYGEKKNRTPLGYAPYQRAVAGKVVFTPHPAEADFLMLGFKKDLVDLAKEILALRRQNPRLRVVIVSEEPLWDTLWSGNFLVKQQVHATAEGEIPFLYLNHINSRIFHFESLPYFPTTSDDFFPRYASLFARNAALSPEDILASWKQCPIPRAYYAEKRDSPGYEKHHPEAQVRALSCFRTRLADLDRAEGVERVGQGWSNIPRRQDRPDWHLEKLAALDRQAGIVSAIENTSAPDYVTEKLFDAYAMLAIPIFHAGPGHAVHRLVDGSTFLDVANLTPEEALQKIQNFEPTLDFATRYLETQKNLATRFTNADNYRTERQRVAGEILKELEAW